MDRAALNEMAAGVGGRSLSRLFEPLRHEPVIKAVFLGPVPRFSYHAPDSSEPIHLGIFGAIHGDEPAAALAIVQFLLQLATHPAWAAGYHIHAYPVCNPTGFEDNTRFSRSGRDLNREFWKGSLEPEVQILEKELTTQHFEGLIQLHADDTSGGLYGFVRGHTLTENLLRPALAAAEKFLPRNTNGAIDGFAARDGIIYKHYEGVLAAPPAIDPMPFEIIFETPQAATVELQVAALLAALRTIMIEYRQLQSFAQNI